MKGLPLAYNRDMQEDKEPFFDTCDTVSGALAVFSEMLRSITIHKDAMRRAAEDGFITATDLADYLVKKGMPFREAHEVVGRAVLRASGLQCGLVDMPLAEYKQLSPLIREDVYDALSRRILRQQKNVLRRHRPRQPEEAPRYAQEETMNAQRSGFLFLQRLSS